MIRWMGMVVLLLVVGHAAWADKFQLKETKGGEDYVVPFTTVNLGDGTPLGQTDKYGRVTITLANGVYPAEVVHGTERKTVTLTLDGGEQLKVVYLK
jgi:hypothetical protein